MSQIIVLSTKTQKKYTLNVQGNTLHDLKAALNNNGIDYSGMTFFEGRTKTELLNDQSTFPENAIIRLTKSEKKITSGAELVTRGDCSTYIKNNPEVAELIKKKTGKNWTNCNTAILLEYCKRDAAKTATPTPTTAKVNNKVGVNSCACNSDITNKDAWVERGLRAGYIDESMAIQLRNAVKVENISDEDMKYFNW